MLVAPSILSADFGNLQRDVEMLNAGHADWIHFDVMDGSFVPNISFGFPVMKAVGRLTQKPLDVHMMTLHPDQFVGAVRDCGASIMTVHQEACTHLHRTISLIHENGMKAGVSLNPATPLCMIEEVLNDVDLILIMSVNPGFGGQKFIPSGVDKIRRLKAMLKAANSNALIEVDGGINDRTAPLVAAAGADVLVAGNYVFSAPDPLKAIESLHACGA